MGGLPLLSSPSARPQVQQGAACSSSTTIFLSWEASIPPPPPFNFLVLIIK